MYIDIDLVACKLNITLLHEIITLTKKGYIIRKW